MFLCNVLTDVSMTSMLLKQKCFTKYSRRLRADNLKKNQ